MGGYCGRDENEKEAPQPDPKATTAKKPAAKKPAAKKPAGKPQKSGKVTVKKVSQPAKATKPPTPCFTGESTGQLRRSLTLSLVFI